MRIFIFLILLIATNVGTYLHYKPSEISKLIPQYSWYEGIKETPVKSEADISKVWQSKKRCCEPKPVLEQNNREFFKSCYKFIDKKEKFSFLKQSYADEKAIVKCLWLMDNATDKFTSARIKEHLINNYFYHDKSIDNCANCAPANTVVRVASELSRHYSSAERNNKKAIELLERVLKERWDETSPWVQIETTQGLIGLYLKDGATKEQMAVLDKYMNDFRSKENDETVSRRIPKLEIIYNKLVDKQPLKTTIINTTP